MKKPSDKFQPSGHTSQGNFGEFEVLGLGSCLGSGSIVFPIQSYAYFIHSFCCIWSAAAAGNPFPFLKVELAGLLISQVASVGAMSFDITERSLVFDTRQTHLVADGSFDVQLPVPADIMTLHPKEIGNHIALPPGGLYVPLGATCTFTQEGGDGSEIYNNCVALTKESF